MGVSFRKGFLSILPFGEVKLCRMLCRVVLGHVLRLASTDFKAHETIRGSEYTSVLGCADGSNQEFVVFDVTQVTGKGTEIRCVDGSWMYLGLDS